MALGLGANVQRVQAAAPDGLEIIIGFAPGGGTDRSVRVITPAWAEAMGLTSPVQYTYAPGAGTVIATRQMLAARKDASVVNAIPIPYTAWTIELGEGGYTLDDVTWIGSYFDDPNVLLVPKNSKYESIDQFIEDARQTEKTVAVSAPMSASHAATVVLREATGAKLKIVPFNGGSESRNAVAGGHVDSCMAPYWSATHVLDLTKAIGIFADENPAPNLWQPVPVNQVLGVQLPALTEPYAMQIATEAATNNPEIYQSMVTALKQAANSPKTREAAAANQSLDLFLKYRDPENCSQFVRSYLDLLAQYRGAMQADLDSL
jgi:tripartite-type tricarboxylate transporter receptor subunit TctC